MIELNALQKVNPRGISLDIPGLVVEAGEFVALVGAPDNGQDVLLDLLTGREQTSMGSVRLCGVDPYQDRQAFSEQVGIMFSEDGLYKNLSVLENLLFQCRLYGLPRRQAETVLAQIGLADQARARVDHLTSGMQRRLSLGRAYLHNPPALVLVEPFQRCDEASIQILRGVLRGLIESQKAILALAGDSQHMEGLYDRIYQLSQGRITELSGPGDAQTSGKPFRIPVKLEGRVALVNPADVLYAAAEGDSAFIQTRQERLPTQFTLTELEVRLARHGFFRAHRSYLVNLQHVIEVIPFTRNSFSLRIDDAEGTLLPLSKSAAGELRDLLDY